LHPRSKRFNLLPQLLDFCDAQLVTGH
jgi:hypothetical protein